MSSDRDEQDEYSDDPEISQSGRGSPGSRETDDQEKRADSFWRCQNIGNAGGGSSPYVDDDAMSDVSGTANRNLNANGPDANRPDALYSCEQHAPRHYGAPHNGAPHNVPRVQFSTQSKVHDMENMSGWNELNGEVLLGRGVQMKPALFQQGWVGPNGWIMYKYAGVDNPALAPVRAMCFNIPVECFSMDASRFNDWQTPMNNSIRAASIAALVGMVATPLSKGWISGNHEEEARAVQQTHGDGGREGGAAGSEAGGEIKKPKRVHQYMFPRPDDASGNVPMVVIGYEDIYDSSRKSVLAVRIWHFVFDKAHSTSDMARKLMNESADESDHSGAAHCPNNQRKTSVVAAAKATRALIGASLESTQLELAAGMCYRHVLNESVYKSLLGHYAGHSDKSRGRPAIDMHDLPAGVLNKHLAPNDEMGCVHPLGFEWVFNAKRPDALAAGLVHLDGTLMDVHPDQMAVSSYFAVSTPASEKDTHEFRVPAWVGSDCDGGKSCFFFQTDPNQLNIFDMVLPHTITGSIKPGVELMALYKERFVDDDMAVDSPLLIARFNNTMTGRDQWMLEQINSITDSIVNFDTVDTSAEQRMDAKTAKKAASRGLASYGQMDGESHVVEPRQVLKEHAYTTSNVHARLVSPWVQEQHSKFTAREAELRALDDGFYESAPIQHEHFDELRRDRDAFDRRYRDIMKELVLLHLSKMNRSFTSRIDKESIPAGYRALWDGLHEELAGMPGGTANMAFALDNHLTDSDRTVFAHMTNWLGTFFEDDCFVDGRDWRLMQELFYHCFEQFGEQTLLLIFCGPKGNGKTLRTERAMRAFVKNWLVMSGPSSAKAGMQGNSDSSNGCNCIYDEMIDELTDGDGSNRTEYWKQILLKRQYVYNKPVIVKGSDGREMHKTFKLLTPHQETHCVCTNRGPAFTKGDEDPNEVKIALIDRAHVHFVRTLGKKTHDDQEFEDHLSDPIVRRKLRMFRITTCLMGMLKLLIFRQPYLKPDTAFAQKLWDQWDDAVNKKYGLPRPSPRKNIKRLENLVTMCCQNAVGHVFLYKQTAHSFQAGQTTEEYPDGKPFELGMLWDCIQLLQPTREIIHMAWTMGLEYNIGTSAMGLNTMTIVAEVCGKQPGDFFNKIPDDHSAHVQENHELAEAASELIAERQCRAAADAANNGQPTGGVVRHEFKQPRTDASILPEFERLLASQRDSIAVEEIEYLRSQLRAKREARNLFAHLCSKSDVQNSLMKDSRAMIDGVLGEDLGSMTLDPIPPSRAGDDDVEMGEGSEAESDGSQDRAAVGQLMWENNEDPFGLSPGDPALLGYHRARAGDFPGAEHCAFVHSATPAEQRLCPYCSSTLAEQEEEAARVASGAEEAAVATSLSFSVSCAWPSILEAGMFYKPQTLMQFAAGKAAYIDPNGCALLATRPVGPVGHRPSIDYLEKTNGKTGASRKDLAWFQGKGEQWKKWGKAAEYIRTANYQAVQQFDLHRDGLRDCLFLCSTRDNARLICEEPRTLSNMRPENCVKTMDNKRVSEDTVCVQVAPYYLPGSKQNAVVSEHHEHLPRDPRAQVKDTKLQRRFDSLYHGGRLSALNVLTSNNVSSKPPIRMHADGIQFSVSAICAHVSLLAECVLDCALQPGLKNMQEKFCNDANGPPGLSRPMAKGRALVGEKRTAEDEPKGVFHTLPYSYDIIGISLAKAMLETLYDDLGQQWVSSNVAKYSECYGLNLTFEALPHMSMRYIGYEETNHQTLSMKLKSERKPDQAYVEAGDPDEAESGISRAHVRRSLGKKVDSAEVAAYISRRQGATSMNGVKGDLFAYSTWLQHTIATLRARGLVTAAPTEPAVRAFADMEHCIYNRVVECASERADPRYVSMSLTRATPGTYEAVEKSREQEAEQPRLAKRAIRSDIHGLGFDPKTMDFGPPVLAARAPRVNDGVRFGAGPDRD